MDQKDIQLYIFSTNLGRRNGRLMQYAGHSIQGFVPDQAALLEPLRL